MKSNNLPQQFTLQSIFLYKIYLSPFISKKVTCRFYPSCSKYAYQAISKYGLFQGGYKAFKRLNKCKSNNLSSCVDYP